MTLGELFDPCRPSGHRWIPPCRLHQRYPSNVTYTNEPAPSKWASPDALIEVIVSASSHQSSIRRNSVKPLIMIAVTYDRCRRGRKRRPCNRARSCSARTFTLGARSVYRVDGSCDGLRSAVTPFKAWRGILPKPLHVYDTYLHFSGTADNRSTLTGSALHLCTCSSGR